MNEKKYVKDDIAVVWKAELCQHAAQCVKNAPKVFKPKERPWIQVDGDSKEAIVNAVRKCPSGALTIDEKA